MRLFQLADHEVLRSEHEPLTEAVISCELQVGFEWEKRTYRAVRLFASGYAFRIEFGEAEHGSEMFANWIKVCSWFLRLRPRNVEVLCQ